MKVSPSITGKWISYVELTFRRDAGSKTPRPDLYGDAPASFLFERQVRLEACTVGVGELLQQRQLAPTADGAVLAA